MVIVISIIKEKFIERVCNERKKEKPIYFFIALFLYGITLYFYSYLMEFTFKQFIRIFYILFLIDYLLTVTVSKKEAKNKE
jgi:hypothetical protein